MNCPKCDGPMWDNRTNKKNPKGPDYKCKDKDCAHAVWLTKKPFQGFQGSNSPPATNDAVKVLEIAANMACKTHKTEISLVDEVHQYYKALRFILVEKIEPQKPEEPEGDEFVSEEI